MRVALDDDTGLPQKIIDAIDAELNERFAPHAGDALYDEIKRVRREELIELARGTPGSA